MTMFQAVTGATLAERIRRAKQRIVFVGPGVSEEVARALVESNDRGVTVAVVLDLQEDTCRIGYGDVEGLGYLKAHATGIALQQHAGVRLGLLVADDDVAIWSPTPRSVDDDRKHDQPNGIVLEGLAADGSVAGPNDGTSTNTATEDRFVQSGSQREQSDAGEASAKRTFADRLLKNLKDERVGTDRIRPESLREVVEALEQNPPAPFDLARKVRVFSTRFQYVETELQGAEWTRRRIKISSLLLNSDLPESLQDILETQVRPYYGKADVSIRAPHIVEGQLAYNHRGEEILVPTTQRDIEKTWQGIKERYLFRVQGFGSLIRKKDLAAFRAEISAFQELLRAWVKGFRCQAKQDEDELVSSIVMSIRQRIEQSGRRRQYEHLFAGSSRTPGRPDARASTVLDERVREGLARMRIKEPRVRVVVKDVSWESSRDQEFTAALRAALPAAALRGWFEEFTAAQERR